MQQITKETVLLVKATTDCNYRIIEIKNRLLALKLMEMGCLEGMIIQKISAAPFNGPLIIRVYPNENLLAIRYEDSADILISEALSKSSDN